MATIVATWLILPNGFSAAASTASQPPSLYIDGKPANYMTYGKQSETMIALKTGLTAMGLQMKWKTPNQEWVVVAPEHEITFRLNSTQAWVDREKKTLKTAPINVKGSIYVPLRFLTEAAGGEVQYVRQGAYNLLWVLSPKQNALTTAMILGDVDTVRSLMTDWKQAVIPFSVNGLRPSDYAARSLEMTKLLLESGFPVNYRDGEYDDVLMSRGGNTTLLYQAAMWGRVKSVEYLLEQGADPRLKSYGDDGWTPLDGANWGKSSLRTEADLSPMIEPASAEDYDQVIQLLKDKINESVAA